MARRQRLDLLSNSTGTGAAFDYQGGDALFMVSATSWGGGNVKLQMQNADGAWVNIQNYATTTPISITADGTANFRAPAGPMRAVATTATGVTACVLGIPSNAAG